MEIRNSTILVTGGASGIGLEFAKQLMQEGATVIITGRDLNKLSNAKKQYPQINIIQNDITSPKDIEVLYKQVTESFPDLNMIINNAGIMRSVEVLDKNVDLGNVADEIDTNFSGTVRMIHQFLPHLMAKKSSAIVNVSSGLAFIPFTISPIYCGTKAAIHVYTQALRLQLKKTTVKVFEVVPPQMEKPLQTAIAETRKGMKTDKMVNESIKGILNDEPEIKPGLASVMKWMSRIAPDFFAKFVESNIEKARRKTH